MSLRTLLGHGDDRGARAVALYFVLVCVLTVPFWLMAWLAPARLLPGLSLSALGIVAPLIAACMICAILGGKAALFTLLSSLWRKGRDLLFIGAIALAVPVLAAMASWSVAGPENLSFADPLALLILVPVFLIAALAEEIGWTAFATERLARRHTILATGLIIGLVWALWHIPALVELGRSAEWIAWWTFWTLGQRVIMVALYSRSASWLWGPVLFHASSNLAWQAAPDAFDPAIETMIIALFAIGLTLAWQRRAQA